MKKVVITFFVCFVFFANSSFSYNSTGDKPHSAQDHQRMDRLVDAVRVFKSKTDSEVYDRHVLALVSFLVKLHPVEQEIYCDMVAIFAHYHKSFESFTAWVKRVRSFEPFYTSINMDHVLKVYGGQRHRITQESMRDPWFGLMMVNDYPLGDELEILDHYWSTLLIYQDVIVQPAWENFKTEMEEMELWFAKRAPDATKPEFGWEKRFKADWKEYEESREFAIKNPTKWVLLEDELNLEVDTEINLEKPPQVIIDNIKVDIEGLFKRIFTWQLLDSYIEDDMLYIRILLETGKVFDLEFAIIEDEHNGQYTIYFILDIPFGKIKAVLSQWEIVLVVKQHSKIKDLSVVTINSRTVLRHAWARNILRLDKVKARLQEKMPEHIKELHQYFDTLE